MSVTEVLRLYRTLMRRLSEFGILATFFLIPVWYRLPGSIAASHLYVTRFLMLIPILVAIFAWLLGGMPGLRDLRTSRWGVRWATVLLALAVWAFFSLTWGFVRVQYPEVGQTAALQLSIVALFAVVVACMGVLPQWIVRVLIAALIGNATLTIAQAMIQHEVGLSALGEFRFSPEADGASVVVSGVLRWVRPYGLMPHPNILAGSLLVGLFAAGAGVLGERAWWRRLAIVGVWLGFGALLLTFSRAAWLGFAGGAVVFLLLVYPRLRESTRREGRGLLAVVGVTLAGMVVIGLLFLVAYRPLISARAGIGEESVEMRSISDRIVFTGFAERVIRERPAFGVGIGSFPWRTVYYLRQTFYDLRGDHVHQIYLYAAAELGLPGLAMFVAALGFGFVSGVVQSKAPEPVKQSSKDAKEDVIGERGGGDASRAGLVAVGVAFAIVGFFDHYPYTILHMQVALWGCIAAAMASTMDQHGTTMSNNLSIR